MRKFLQRILRKPILRLSEKYASNPDYGRIQAALSQLYDTIHKEPGKRGPILPFTIGEEKFIIFSDQHKGAKNGADDFANAENNYLQALDYYNQNQFHFISLGDNEELWENTIAEVIPKNKITVEKEKLFLAREAFTKVFGNHDLYWDNDPFAGIRLNEMFGKKIPVFEGVILQTSIDGKTLEIFLTHGHQGDAVSDGNWFSKWFIARVWAPLQSYLQINPNTPAYDAQLKSVHNHMMYDWITTRKNMVLITGHTHQPVFESLTHLERLYRKLGLAKASNEQTAIAQIESDILNLKLYGIVAPDFTAYQPTYFNSGCCCFDDGDITGIEIEKGMIRLVKWETKGKAISKRMVLEEAGLAGLFV